MVLRDSRFDQEEITGQILFGFEVRFWKVKPGLNNKADNIFLKIESNPRPPMNAKYAFQNLSEVLRNNKFSY